MPMNCQRTWGGKKLRYVRRICDCGVAQEPPRSTIWLHMNLPLYSPTAPAAARNPGYGRYELAVHSQTSPNIWDSVPLSPAACGCRNSLSMKFPVREHEPEATSHSYSVASLAPAQRAKASAS